MWRSILGAAAVVALSTSASLAQDAAAGEKVFNKCKVCHMIGPGAQNRVGPMLNGIVGRVPASVEKFAYSKAAVEHAPVTGTWTEEAIFEYLADPSKYIGGPSKMAFKLANEQERKDVIAYIAQFNADGSKK